MAPRPCLPLSMRPTARSTDFQERHRHQEWLKFLRLLDQAMPPHLDLHLIGDNYATHKHPKVNAWLKRHSRFHLHFIPTSSSWLNLVERWFKELTDKRLRRGRFTRVADLTEAITVWAEHWNAAPSPTRPHHPPPDQDSGGPLGTLGRLWKKPVPTSTGDVLPRHQVRRHPAIQRCCRSTAASWARPEMPSLT